MTTEIESGLDGRGPSSSRQPKPAKSNQHKGGRGNDSPTTQLSKALSYILRHGTLKEGLKVRPDGYVPLDDVLARPKVSKIRLENGNAPSLEDVRQIVDSNDKKRFEMTQKDNIWLIRAVQGHSIANVTELDHIPITLDNLHILAEQKEEASLPKNTLPPGVEVLHGTNKEAWEKILASRGLHRMKRNHIHLAKGRPGSSNVISGMRSSSQVILHVDIISALKQGDIPFFMASNGAVLTSGQGETGILPLKFITKAEEGKTGNLIWQSAFE